LPSNTRASGDWLLEDPTGPSMEDVRRIRDEIRNRVRALVEMHG
jgi:protein-tyrosine-phosphatase